mgnify:CR=1 FL=1
MKKNSILIIAIAALGALTSCTTDAATGQRHLSPELEAAATRVATHALTSAEASLNARIDSALRVPVTGK